MASTCLLQGSIRMKMHHIMALLLTLACFKSVTECKQTIQLRGHVGGEVAFYCPVDQHKKLSFLYLQKGHVFVNGFYDSKDVNEYKWPNSRVDRAQNVVYVSGLNISHAGMYTCFYQYSDESSNKHEDIALTVTANYSKPTLHYNNNVACTDEQDHCLVTCSSHGGYPKSKVMWTVSEEQRNAGIWRTVNSSEVGDKDSMLYNVSSVVSINCTMMTHKNISCSVDGVTSVLLICEQKSKEAKERIIVAVVAVAIAVSLPVAIVCMWKKCKKRSIPDNNDIL